MSRFELLSGNEIFNNENYCDAWEQIALSSSVLYSFYKSATWLKYTLGSKLIDHTVQQNKTEIKYLLCFDEANELISVVPIQQKNISIDFTIGALTVFKQNIKTINCLGGLPPTAVGYEGYDVLKDILEAVFREWGNKCIIRIPYVFSDNNLFFGNRLFKNEYESHCTHENMNHYQIHLCNTFDEYMQNMSSKSRNVQRKKVKLLYKHFQDDVELIMIDSSDKVEMFLEEAVKISAQSWQIELGQQMSTSEYEIDEHKKIAERKYFRSYLLRCGSKYAAFIRGYQFGDVYYYSRPAYDKNYAECSPGVVLLYLVLRDLHIHNSPKLLNFQEGDYDYKRLYSTETLSKCHLLVWKKANVSIPVLGVKLFNQFLQLKSAAKNNSVIRSLFNK